MVEIKVRLYGNLVGFAKGQKEVSVSASSVKESIDQLIASYGELAGRLLDKDGNIETFINVLVNNKDIRYLDGLATEVKEGDKLIIMPAIGGG
jgi:molybdopterin synthase sulfur carrier subunit